MRGHERSKWGKMQSSRPKAPTREDADGAVRMAYSVLQFAVDAEAWVISLTLAVLFRFDFVADKISWFDLGILAVLAVVLQAGLGWFFALYRGRHQQGAFHEAQTLLGTVVTVGVLLLLTNVLLL